MTLPLIVDYTTCCDDCLLSQARTSDYETLRYKHGKPFYCLHPDVSPKKVAREDKPFTQRPDWCPLNNTNVLVKAAPPGYTPEEK